MRLRLLHILARLLRAFGAKADVAYWAEGNWSIYKGTLGYGIYYCGREIWSVIEGGDFLASRWYDTVEEAVTDLPNAKRILGKFFYARHMLKMERERNGE